MALKAAVAQGSPDSSVALLLGQASLEPPAAAAKVTSEQDADVAAAAAAATEDVGAPLPASEFPEHYKPIKRIPFTTIEEMIRIMTPQSEEGVPLIIEGTDTMNAEKWADLSHLTGLLKQNKVLVKKSPTNKFRYYDMKHNTGKYKFEQPVTESQRTVPEFLEEAERLLQEGRLDRMYLQETLSGHAEMAEEFATWKWEMLIRVSSACGWGLPDSNELFVGMRGVETPLHFDERENLFFQVRGLKELVTFPFVKYTSLYPFPTTHPCDRQSMVGTPVTPDLDAFPRFRDVVGHYAVLKAGDLVYLPYGWWHWLRNMSHLAVSVSFWSTTPPNDLSKGIPETFSEHMLTRVRRNLESMIANQHGPENHVLNMLALKDAIELKKIEDPVLVQVRGLLAAVRMPLERQDPFLLEMIEGRFGIDYSKHVQG